MGKVTCLFVSSLYSHCCWERQACWENLLSKKEYMSRRTIHTLTWSSENNAYELATQAQPSQHFGVEDEHSWLDWLATHTSFLFQGRAGSLRAYKESRPRGENYWYAYSFTEELLRKRYLGRSSALSFARLEEVAGMLQGKMPCPLNLRSLKQRRRWKTAQPSLSCIPASRYLVCPGCLLSARAFSDNWMPRSPIL